MTLQNCCLINCIPLTGCGIGDIWFHFIVAIILSKSYEKVFIFINHAPHLLPFVNNAIFAIDFDNIFVIDREIESNDEMCDYFNNFNNVDYDFSKKITIDNNTYINFLLRDLTCANKKTSLYLDFFRKVGIKKSDFSKIKFNLTEKLLEINKDYHKKFIEKVGNNYICVFNAPDRFHDISSLKLYKKEFNKDDLPVIYFTINNYNGDDKLTIVNVLGEYMFLYHLHEIIANSKEVHFYNSYPACYFFLMSNIEPEYFKNTKKYCYNRYTQLLNCNESTFDIEYTNLSEFPFYNFKFIVHQNDFVYRREYYLGSLLDHFLTASGSHCETSGHHTITFFDNNEHFYYDQLTYLKKNLFNFGYCNKTPISSTIDFMKKKNIITLDLDANKINDDEIENIIEKNLDEIIKKYTNESEVNIALVKYHKPFYLIIEEREMDDDFNDLSDNSFIKNYDVNYVKFFDKLRSIASVDYIYCYIDDVDKDYFISFLS